MFEDWLLGRYVQVGIVLAVEVCSGKSTGALGNRENNMTFDSCGKAKPSGLLQLLCQPDHVT